MAKRRENETVRCRYCGEQYSVTYKRCPFCDERPRREYTEEELNATRPFTFVNGDEEEPVRREPPVRRPARSTAEEDEAPLTAPAEELPEEEIPAPPRRRSSGRGGKRLATKSRPARVSAPVRDEEEPREQPRRPVREEPVPSRSVRREAYDEYDEYDEDDRPGISPLRLVGWIVCLALVVAAAIIVFSFLKPLLKGDPKPSPTPTVQTTPTPGQTGSPVLGEAPFTLDHSELTLSGGQSYQLKVAFTSADAAAAVTWSSSNDAVATVDQFGTVTPVGSGDAVITASLADGRSRSCTIHCSDGGSPVTPPPAHTTAPTTPAPSGGNLSINYTDISFSTTYPNPVKLKVSGTVSVPVWSIANETVATISSDGTVTPVANGTTTASATVDGKTLECIIRVNFR